MAKYQRDKRSWFQKFRFALIGIAQGIKGQSSFLIHILVAVVVLIVAAFLQVQLHEWAILVLCITMVMAAEMFNSALERVARAITDDQNEDIGAGLNIASAAVLVTAMGAAIIGAVVLGSRLLLVFLGDTANLT